MIKLIFIPFLVLLGCGTTKSNQSASKSDSVIVEESTGLNQRDSAITPEVINMSLPICIKNKIDSFKVKPAHEKPQRVVEYMYKGKKVYYVVMPCCDFFNEVYDENCKLLGSPDGGFTGRGDGKLPDFFTEAKNEKLIWGTPK
ncbi:MAG: hypothetical protein ABI685_09020 [Ferruginibacter sp.]